MKPASLFLAAFFVVTACAYSCLAADLAADDQPLPRSGVDSFVFCTDPAKAPPVPIYQGICRKRQVGTLNCGEKVEVLSRHDDLLRIASPERPPRFVSASAISRQADKFVPFDDASGIEDKGAPDCAHPGPTFGTGGEVSRGSQPDRNVTPPHLIFGPPPPFSEQARKKKIQGVVTLSLTVTVDGAARDVKVVKGLGYGLDEKAVETVSGWKFKPALKDGEPIEKEISVQVDFHLY